MKNSKHWLFNIFTVTALILASQLITACGDKRPAHQEAVIEETEVGMDILQQEFGECDEDYIDENPTDYVQNRPVSGKQKNVEDQYPHRFASLGQMFPLRGSWRQSKEEIMDLVDRHVWSPEKNKVVRILDYFDMVLMINVAPRDHSYPEESSAQRMQVLIRKDTSNNIEDWQRLHVWPISTGKPCGKKIATFTGVFKLNPQRFYPRYYSKLFDDADMYETMFLYHQYQNGSPTGVAIHGTYKTSHLGRRDSGGCIRIHRNNSQCLYKTLTNESADQCLNTGNLDFWGKVPSLLPRNGEADPEFLSSGNLEVDGYKVMIAIFNDSDDLL